MQTIAHSSFTTVKTEGGLLPIDLLQRVADGRDLPGLRPDDYHLYPGERLNEAVNRAWNRCLGAWLSFADLSAKLPASETGTTLTRERWLLVLFQELGFGRLPATRGGLPTDDGVSYPISHVWECTPIHLVTFRQPLDRRSEVATQVKRSPHSLVQEFLNRTRTYTWGIISNGLQLRILRDNASLRRAAFVEFDLESMMTGELYAEFSLLWLVCHQSRFELHADASAQPAESATAQPAKPRRKGNDEEADRDTDADMGADEDEEAGASDAAGPTTPRLTCWLEVWSKTAADRGIRALDALRDGVQEAIEALGSGFLRHPANAMLRARLQSGDLSTTEYYHQLRRLIYRQIFVATAEDRDLLLLPDAPTAARRRYTAWYALRRLRDLSAQVRGSAHADLYRQLRLVFTWLRDGCDALALPGLGSFLFSARSTPDLDDLELANLDLLAAVRALSFTEENGVRRPVDYRNLDSEEFGSIYESLLELHPRVNLSAAAFTLEAGAGSERKTTGSHYTPTPLVESLLDTALEPVVADRLAQAEVRWKQGKDKPARDQLPSAAESLRNELADALLSIKVLDAATGSGHMLIGAGRRLARHLARIRSGDDEPTPEALRHALREVVRRCLYGVDLNEMAVELCKVALWMESMEPGKPLGFLDAHIQCGNSLIGVTPELDTSEIPDDAFQPVTGDDRAAASALRRRNRRERTGQTVLALHGDAGEESSAAAQERVQMWAAFEALDEDAVGQVAVKAQRYDDYLASPAYERARCAADVWTAAFFWPIPPGSGDAEPAPTQAVLADVRRGELARHYPVLDQVRSLAKRHRFFHWELQFPDVFKEGRTGFDVELMNPPWERIKLQEKEWFAPHRPDIATAPNAAARRRLIAGLETDDPLLWQKFQAALAGAESESNYIRNSGCYPLCGRGDVNTYAVFAELARLVLAPTGRAGIIVPTGIATDDTTKFYFQDVMETGALASLYDFENRHGIFPSVHRSYKFSLLTLRGPALGTGKPAEFVFFALDVDDLHDEDRRFSLTAAEIALLNPNTKTCPIFRSKRDAELTKAVYHWSKTLQASPGLSWNFKLGTQFHSSMDAKKFEEVLSFVTSGWRLNKQGVFTSVTGKAYRLYEGKMFSLYDHRGATVVLSDSAIVRQRQSRLTSENEHQDPNFLPLSFFCVKQSEFAGYPQWQWVVCFKKVTSPTNERTLLAAVLPECAANDSIHLLLPDESAPPAKLYACLLGEMSAFVSDYVARQKLGGVNMNFYVFEQLPLHNPAAYQERCRWLHPTSELLLADWLLPRVLELTYTAWDLQPFALDCGYAGPPFRWDEARRFLLRCELDAAYFHLYGITRDDVDYILETFPIVKRKDLAAHGEYRTKRTILEIYDALAAAQRTAQPYVSRLDPPPADPRVAHEENRQRTAATCGSLATE